MCVRYELMLALHSDADSTADGRAHLLADRDERLADSRSDDRCAP
jgi:hypothetical protein